jgi:hypothetical protein
VDGSESSGVKVARGHKIEDVRQRLQGEQELIARLRTANVRFSDAQTERIWAIVSAHQAGLSIRRIAGATGLSSNAQTLTYSYDDADQLLSVASSTPMETSRAAWASPLAGMPRIASRPLTLPQVELPMVTCAMPIPTALFESRQYARTTTRCTPCVLAGAEYVAPESSAVIVPTGQTSHVRSPGALWR